MIRDIASNPWTLGLWLALMLPSLVIVLRDLATRNAHLMSLMKVVWGLTVLYSGPLGLAIYWLTGRKEIADDALWRRGFRSVAHCYSGCGLGEVTGLIIAVGLLQAGTTVTVALTFSLAYAVGYALTVGPLMQDGVPARQAMKDALISETPSIFIMEVVAISTDLLLAGDAGPGEVLFWTSIILSLSCGLIAAYPVNLVLLHFGVKEGMMDPRHTHHGQSAHAQEDDAQPDHAQQDRAQGAG